MKQHAGTCSMLDGMIQSALRDAAQDRRKIVKAVPTPGRQEAAFRADLQMLRRA